METSPWNMQMDGINNIVNKVQAALIHGNPTPSLRKGLEKYILALQTTQQAMKLDGRICFSGTIAFTHSLQHVFMRAKNDRSELSKVYNPLANNHHQLAFLTEFDLGENRLTPVSLDQTLKHSSSAWIAVTLEGNRGHMFGLNRSQSDKFFQVFDVNNDPSFTNLPGDKSSFSLLSSERLFVKINDYHKSPKETLKIITFV